MKKNVILLIFVISLSILVVLKFDVKAYETTVVTFNGIDSTLDMNDKSTYIKINDDSLNYDTSITFLVHGLASDPSYWSNTLGNVYGININSSSKSGEFGYDSNSIIEVIRRRVNADVYLVNNCESTLIKDDTTNEVVDVQVNSFMLKKLFVTTNSKGQKVYAENNYISSISNINNHVVVIYDASASVNAQVMDIAYKELEYVINKITYDVVKTLNSKVKINLIGHSRGGLINMKYAIDYPYNVDSLVSLGTPYNGTSITPLNSLINNSINPEGDILGLNGLINCPGGIEISNLNITQNNLKDEWIKMNEKFNPNINFIPIAGETGMTYFMQMIDEAYTQFSNNLDFAKIILLIKSILIEFEKIYVEGYEEAYMPEYLDDNGERLYNYLLPVIIKLYIDNSGLNLTEEESNSIITLLCELYYSYEVDELILKTDLFVDYYSQLANGFDVDSNGTPIKMTPYKKIFTLKNSSYENKSVDAIGIVHNNESRDLELINYILLNINFSGNDSYCNTCYLSDDSLAIMGQVLENNEANLNIPNNIQFCIYNDVSTSFSIEGVSKIFNTNANNNIITIVIGDNVKNIEPGAFKNFDNISAFNVNNTHNYYCIDAQNNLYSNDYQTLIKYCNLNSTNSFVLPNETIYVDDYAFKNNINLLSIDLNNVKYVGEKSFYNAYNLENISGDNLKLVENFAFHKTKWLSNITNTTKLGKVLIKYNGMEENLLISDCMCIYSYAFIDNEYINKVICDDDVTLINKYAFINNSNLKEVFLLSTNANILNSFSFVGNNDTLNCYMIRSDNMVGYEYGQFRNCYQNFDIVEKKQINCLTTLTNLDKKITKGSAIYYEFNIDCAKSYKFQATSTSKLIMELYDSQMNLIPYINMFSDDELTTTLQDYINKGIYYLKIYYEDTEASGDINLSFQCTWPVITQSINVGTSNILTHLHEDENGNFTNHLYLGSTNGEGFYKLKIIANGNSEGIMLPAGAIKVYIDSTKTKLVNLYSVIDSNKKAINIADTNEMTMFLLEYGSYYIEVCLPSDDYETLNLNITKVDESNINLFDLSENISQEVVNLSGVSNVDSLQKVELKQAGQFILNTQGFTQGELVILKQRLILDGEIIWDENIITDITNLSTNTFNLVEGTYFIGYVGANIKTNLTFKLTRVVTSYGSDNLEADPSSVGTYGSEVTLNGGELYSNVITQGFTRIIYLSTGESRLDYYWYSNNENAALITDFGTVIGQNVNTDTYVKIMAVNIEDPSKVYVKKFLIKKDTKTFDSDPIVRYMTIEYDSTKRIDYQINLSSENVPINWLQSYTWTSLTPYVSVDQFGRIYAYEQAIGGTYTITGEYKLNPRVKVYITIIVK